jgi:hypothetical protein
MRFFKSSISRFYSASSRFSIRSRRVVSRSSIAFMSSLLAVVVKPSLIISASFSIVMLLCVIHHQA